MRYFSPFQNRKESPLKSKDSRNGPTPPEKPAGKPGKAPYTSPALRIYGAVSAMTQNNPGVNTGDAMGMMNTPSDRSLKQNIARVGTHPLGIGLYLFDYKPEFKDRFGHARRLGVMADEVETVLPAAVVVHPEGFKMVHYALLGIQSLH